jgi:hypothetical protein
MGITYRNTKTTIPNVIGNLHDKQPFGIAYSTDSHFVHFYCSGPPLWTLSPGLTAIQKKTGNIEDWVKEKFGAEDIQNLNHDPGHTVEGVWRPGILFDGEIDAGLLIEPRHKHQGLIAAKLLLESLDQILQYVEPDEAGLQTYSHKTRELLILACTEVENQWREFIQQASTQPITGRLTTNDYVKLHAPLHLSEFTLHAKPYQHISPICPFEDWSTDEPTRSLPWYHAYNQTKHDRSGNFDKATLHNCIHAVCASIVLQCVRFSPHALLRGTGSVQSLFGQLFAIELKECDRNSFYFPLIALPSDTREDFLCYDSYQNEHNKPWIVTPLQID